jgi:hypothetical protein
LLNCLICSQVHNISQRRERSVYVSSDFTIWPCLGSLCFGHLLVIPNKHEKSCLGMGARRWQELRSIFSHYGQYFMGSIVTPVIVEYGHQLDPRTSSGVGSPNSKWISHAHAHLLPIDRSFHDILKSCEAIVGPRSVRSRANETDMANVHREKPYFFISDTYDNGFIWENKLGFVAHPVRRLHASLLGQDSIVKWTKTPNDNLMNETKRRLKPYFHRLSSKERTRLSPRKGA